MQEARQHLPRVSIVIPVYNRVDFTQKCLESLILNTSPELFEVVIVDNASSDGTNAFLERLEGDVTIVRNGANLGFAKACNQGAEAATGEYLLFLNNDTEAEPKWLEPLITTLVTEPDVAAVGCRLLYPDRTLQHAGVLVADNQLHGIPICVTHRFHKFPAEHPSAMRRADLQAVTGAAVLLRATSFHQVGGFDEGYWNGYEDLDLCFKLLDRGWKIRYEPRSCLIHHESVSGPERYRKNQENDARLHQKWYGRLIPAYVITPEGQIYPNPLYRAPVEGG